MRDDVVEGCNKTSDPNSISNIFHNPGGNANARIFSNAAPPRSKSLLLRPRVSSPCASASNSIGSSVAFLSTRPCHSRSQKENRAKSKDSQIRRSIFTGIAPQGNGKHEHKSTLPKETSQTSAPILSGVDSFYLKRSPENMFVLKF